MTLEQEILFNQFGQGIVTDQILIKEFNSMGMQDKRNLLRYLVNLIVQSKSTADDIDDAIFKSRLKPTYTPCLLIRKGMNHGNYEKIINLPEYEMDKVFRLFIYLFKEGYVRRYLEEKGNPDKWWYQDLSKEENINRVREEFGS